MARALGYLDNLSREAGNDVSLKVDLADAYQKIGDVQGNPYSANLGDVEGARASYTKLLDLRRAIRDARRDRPSAVGLGRAHSRIGDLDLARAKYPEAVESYQQALTLFDEGRSGADGNDETAEDRARVYNRKGVALTWSGRRAEARTALEEAIRLTELFTSRPGASRLMRRGLAVSHANLGDVFHYEKDFERALGAHRRGTDLAQQLLQEHPSESTAKRDVIMMLARVGGDLVELKRHDEAIAATKEVIALEEELIKDDPRNVQFQFDLADLYANQAISQRETGQLDAALRSIEQSIQTSERAAARNPAFVAHRFNFAGAISQLGRIQRDRHAFGEAIRAFRRSIEVYGSVPGDQRDPAQVLITKGLLGESLADEASRSNSPRLWSEAETALQHALDEWRAFQQGGGSAEDHREEIARLSAALDQVYQEPLALRAV